MRLLLDEGFPTPPNFDPGQLLAYLPEIRRMIDSHGPSIVFLPSPRLDRSNLAKAGEAIGLLAADLGISNRQIRQQARTVIRDELAQRAELDRFGLLVG